MNAVRELSEPSYGTYTDEEAKQVNAMEDEVEAELAERRTSLRWSGVQLAIVKQAAAMTGTPYQTYVKEAAFRRALKDLERFATLKQSA